MKPLKKIDEYDEINEDDEENEVFEEDENDKDIIDNFNEDELVDYDLQLQDQESPDEFDFINL